MNTELYRSEIPSWVDLYLSVAAILDFVKASLVATRLGTRLDAQLGRGYYCFMKFRLIIEKDPETGRYSSVFPEIPGCASAGDTEEEAIANAKEALELWFEPTEIPLAASAKLIEVSAKWASAFPFAARMMSFASCAGTV